MLRENADREEQKKNKTMELHGQRRREIGVSRLDRSPSQLFNGTAFKGTRHTVISTELYYYKIHS